MEVETVKREKETDEIKEKIRELIEALGEKETSLKDVRKIMDRVKGSLSEDIIKERERI